MMASNETDSAPTFQLVRHAGEERRHGEKDLRSRRNHKTESRPTLPADADDERSFPEKKLPEDGFSRGSQSHADTDFASAFADADEHYVHYAGDRRRKKCLAMPTAPIKSSMPTMIMRLAWAPFTVSQMLAASSSRGSKL